LGQASAIGASTLIWAKLSPALECSATKMAPLGWTIRFTGSLKFEARVAFSTTSVPAGFSFRRTMLSPWA
jgi:hypothetical protein